MVIRDFVTKVFYARVQDSHPITGNCNNKITY